MKRFGWQWLGRRGGAPLGESGDRAVGPIWKILWAVLVGWAMLGLDRPLDVMGLGQATGWAQESRRAETYRTAVTDARRWMAKRDLDQASQALRLAQEYARTDEEKQEVERLESLLDYLRQFWQLLIKGSQKFEPGQEIEVELSRMKKIKVAFVEAVAGGLTLRVEGTNRLFLWKTMPTEIVLALAKRTLAQNAASKVGLGAFLAVDEKGDLDQARKLWEEAARAGVDVGHLLAELDASEAAAKKPPLPKDDQLQEMEKAVKQEYARHYARATVPSVKEELARKLLADVQKTDDAMKRFVMLREARDLAASASELRLAASAIEQMAQLYDVDVIRMKLEMLQKAAEGARGPSQYRDVVLLSLNLADEAVRKRRQTEAREAITVAKEAARKSQSRSLITQAMAVEEKLLGKKK